MWGGTNTMRIGGRATAANGERPTMAHRRQRGTSPPLARPEGATLLMATGVGRDCGSYPLVARGFGKMPCVGGARFLEP